MKSSKIENIFNYTPPAEDTKTLSPFSYYQPFQSSFDPDLPVPPPKTTVRLNAPQVKRRGERPVGGLQMSGGGILNHVDGGFGPRPTFHVKNTFPEASTSTWGDPEGRSLCSSAWRGPVSPGPSFSGDQGQKHLMSGMGIPSVWMRGMEEGVAPKGGAGSSGFGSLDGASYRTGGSLCPSTGQTASFDGSYSNSTYYPLMLAKNMGQNMYKTGHSRPMMCNFCKNNKEVPDIYLNHYLHDPETKVLSCPVLRKHVCECRKEVKARVAMAKTAFNRKKFTVHCLRTKNGGVWGTPWRERWKEEDREEDTNSLQICGGTGDQAHTLQYCPVNRERGLQSKVPVLLKTRTITNSTGKIRRN